MKMHSPFSYPFAVFLLAASAACLNPPLTHASADGELRLTSTRVAVSADCITDSLTDLSAADALDPDYDIRVRWVGDTLMDLTTLGMRCDFTCRGDSLLLTMIETGGDIEVFDSPVALNFPGSYSSKVRQYGGTESNVMGRSSNYVVESILINSNGDTLKTLMNKQLLVGTLCPTHENSRFDLISLKELRSYYVKDNPWPVATVITTSYYDAAYKGLGRSVFAIDLITPFIGGRSVGGDVSDDTSSGRAVARLSPFSRLPQNVFPDWNRNRSAAYGQVPEFNIVCIDGIIRINVIGEHSGSAVSYTVVVSDVRGIVWHDGEFFDSTIIDTYSLPRGEYQVTISDGIIAHTEKLLL